MVLVVKQFQQGARGAVLCVVSLGRAHWESGKCVHVCVWRGDISCCREELFSAVEETESVVLFSLAGKVSAP